MHVNERCGGSPPVCGTDAVRVYYAYYGEDDNRGSDASGPFWDSQTLVGVHPGL